MPDHSSHNFQPLVSVIIPAYNRASIISETLKSVAAQTYNNWECIVVDDPSTDNTIEIVESFCNKDDRFKLYRNKRTKGAPGARNTGIEYASGKYIIFLDSDDLLLSHCLSKRIEYVINNPATDLLISLQKRLENGIEKNYVNIPTEHHPLVRFFCVDPVSDIPWLNNSILIRRDFIADNKIWWDESIKLHQDIQFNLALLINNPVFYWSLNDFDSYWTFYDDVKNIGSDLDELYEKKFKMLQIYYLTYTQVTNQQVKPDVTKQYHALVIWFALYYINRPADDFRALCRFLNSKTLLGEKNVLIIKLIRMMHKLKRNLLVKHRVLHKLTAYITEQYPTVIKDGLFLKIAELPESLKQKVYSNA